MVGGNSALAPYPWHKAIAEQWLSQRQRFAHAWLIHGLGGIGKVQFAKAGAAALLCSQPVQHLACGQCASCQWVLSGNHPDVRFIRPETLALEEDPEYAVTTGKTPSKHIRVEQLRALTTWFTTASHRGGYKVAVLYPAESLNAISANALLKVLEEPTEKMIFLLVTNQVERLLPTIISRCRRLALAVPEREQSIAWLGQQMTQPEHWLAAVGGAPVAAYQAAQSHEQPYPPWLEQLCQLLAQQNPKAILALAPELEKQPTAEWLDVLQRFYVDVQMGLQGLPARYYPGLAKQLQQIASQHSAVALQQQWKWLITQKQYAEHPLNAKLLVHTALERVAHSSRISS